MSTDIVKVGRDERCLDHWVGQRLIDWATGHKGSDETKKKLRSDLEAFARDLAGPSPTPVEIVLADSAALSWCALRLAEAQWAGASQSEEGLTIPQSDHAQRRIDRAHRRLMSSLKTLATVRRLGLPTIQLNVAERQVNVAGS